MELAKNVQQQTTTTRLTRTCTRALVTLSSYPGSPVPGLCTHSIHFASDTEAEMLSRWWLAPVCDTDCLQPLKQTHDCSLWSRWCRSFLDTSGCRHCRCCDRLPVAPSRAPLARFLWLRRRHLAREAPRLSRLQKAFCFCEKRCSTSFQSMKRQPAVRCCGLSAFSEQRIGGVQIDTFEVGLGFQEELGEVFGHLAADGVLEGSHVRSVQRLCVRCAVPLLGVTTAHVHVRVNRVDHVQESVLRDPVRRSVGHEPGFHMRSCEIPKRAHKWMTRSCKSLRSLAMCGGCKGHGRLWPNRL